MAPAARCCDGARSLRRGVAAELDADAAASERGARDVALFLRRKTPCTTPIYAGDDRTAPRTTRGDLHRSFSSDRLRISLALRRLAEDGLVLNRPRVTNGDRSHAVARDIGRRPQSRLVSIVDHPGASYGAVIPRRRGVITDWSYVVGALQKARSSRHVRERSIYDERTNSFVSSTRRQRRLSLTARTHNDTSNRWRYGRIRYRSGDRRDTRRSRFSRVVTMSISTVPNERRRASRARSPSTRRDDPDACDAVVNAVVAEHADLTSGFQRRHFQNATIH